MRMALNIKTSRDTARCGRCFRALFGILFRPGALLTLRPLMASWTSSGLVNLGLLAGLIRWDLSATSTISIAAGKDWSPAETEPPDCRQGLRLSQSLSERFPPGVTRRGDGVGTLITLFSLSTAIGLQDGGFRVWNSTVRSSTHWAGGSPTSAGGWPQLSERGPCDLPPPPQPVLQAWSELYNFNAIFK